MQQAAEVVAKHKATEEYERRDGMPDVTIDTDKDSRSRDNSKSPHGLRTTYLVGKKYAVSEQVADKGEHFYKGSNEKIDLVELPQRYLTQV